MTAPTKSTIIYILMEEYFIGIDYGETKIAVAASKKDCHIIEKLVIPSDINRRVEVTMEAVEQLIEKANLIPSDVLAFGLGAPWLMVQSTGRTLGEHIKEELEQKYKKPVERDNDSNVAAYGEYRFGAGRGHQNILYLTISTGIGAGIITNGKIYSGARGRAGFAGHISLDPDGPACACGLKGCFHIMASGTSVVR
ncbi:MAG: ROK family protein, partial [bacterium]